MENELEFELKEEHLKLLMNEQHSKTLAFKLWLAQRAKDFLDLLVGEGW